MNDRIIHFTLGTVVGSMLTGLVAVTNLYSNILPTDIIKTYNQGRADALKLNPVSWELEQTCLGLWAGSQEVR